MVRNKSNTDGMNHTLDYAAKDFNGLCFVNLVDFDMLYGHRNDVDGYANALTELMCSCGSCCRCCGPMTCCSSRRTMAAILPLPAPIIPGSSAHAGLRRQK